MSVSILMDGGMSESTILVREWLQRDPHVQLEASAAACTRASTCFEQMDRPRPVPPRLRGRFISSSLPCTYSLNRLRRPRCAMPTPAATANHDGRHNLLT